MKVYTEIDNASEDDKVVLFSDITIGSTLYCLGTYNSEEALKEDRKSKIEELLNSGKLNLDEQAALKTFFLNLS